MKKPNITIQDVAIAASIFSFLYVLFVIFVIK